MQRYKYSLLLSMLYMLQAVSPPIIRSSKTVRATSGICQDCLLLPLAWLSIDSNKEYCITLHLVDYT